MNILIVKLGALGDVLRTTPLLTAFKQKLPASRITWVVDARHRGILEDNPLIDELLSYSPETLSRLREGPFDWAVNLDKEEEALLAIEAARASKKMGFGRGRDGKLCALDSKSEYAVRLGVDDELKFRLNRKTYQQISFEQVGFEFQNEEYVFNLDGRARAEAQRHLSQMSVFKNGGPVVGINTGSGARFAGKRLPIGTLVELCDMFGGRLGAAVYLLGGEEEIERNREIGARVRHPVVNTGSHPIRTFAAIVERCDLVVSGDTTAMHVAIATRVPVVAYFGSTCAAEIELYGRGRKIISGISCAPCYKKNCPIDEQCMKDMRADEIIEAARGLLAEPRPVKVHLRKDQ